MLDANDPQLTAYVLGELDEAQRREVQAALEKSPDLQRAVEEIRQAAELLSGALVAEPCPELTAEQHASIERESQAPSQPVELPAKSPSGWRRVVAIAGVAAALLVMVGSGLWMQFGENENRSTAARDEAPADAALPLPNYESDGVEYAQTEEFRVDQQEEAEFESEMSARLVDSLDARSSSRKSRVIVDGSEADGEGKYEGQVVTGPVASNGSGVAGRGRRQSEVGDAISGGQPADPFGADRSGSATTAGSRVAGRGFRPQSGPVGGQPGESTKNWPGFRPGGGLAGSGAPSHAGDVDAIGSFSRTAGAAAPGGIGGGGFGGAVGTPGKDGDGGSVPAVRSQLRVAELDARMKQSQTRADADPSNTPLRIMPAEAGASQDQPALAGRQGSRRSGAELGQSEGRDRGRDKLQQSAQGDAKPDPNQSAGERFANQRENEPAQAGEKGADEAEQQKIATAKKAESLGQQAPRSWRRVRATPNASRLMVGDRDELPLEGMQASVQVDGFRARVLLDCYYYNDKGRQLEGEFKLRLPNDASLYYFAFGQTAFKYRPMVDQLASVGFLPPEIVRSSGAGPGEILRARGETWTGVKEARLVTRQKAAHAYSETVRRRIDPALVEWSGAGVFNARVYPLLPQKLHRIVIGYDVNLTRDGEDLVYQLDLPEGVSQRSVDLNLAALPGAAAEVTPAVRPFASGGRAFYHFDDPPQNSVSVRIHQPGAAFLAGEDAQAGKFFATRFTPNLDAGGEQAGSSNAIFLVDTSLSASPDRFNVWLNMMRQVLTNNRDTIDSFGVLFFNIETHWWQQAFTPNTPENVDELMRYCNTLALEGATDLRLALSEATRPGALRVAGKYERPDIFLLSDGAVTWGETNLHLIGKALKQGTGKQGTGKQGTGGTLFAYNTGMTGTAIGVLDHLARESGGAVFSIATEDEIAAASTAHRRRPWELLAALAPGGRDLLVAGRPKSIYPGQQLLVTGRGEPAGELLLHLRRGEEKQTLHIAFDQRIESELAARLYGQTAVGQLEDLASAAENVAAAYARHFRVTGRTCSLLMLDREADYARFNIKPEDDAIVVASSNAADIVNQKLDEFADRLENPKQALLAWLAAMENTPGARFEVPTALQLVVENLPDESFDVAPARLVRKDRGRDSISKAYFQTLDAAELDYDQINNEAARRLDELGPADALAVLSNLIERSPGDVVLARDVAFSALDWDLPGQAYPLLKRVAMLRPYEPQIYPAMAHCLAQMDRADLAMVYYETALAGQWHERYRDVRQIAAVQYADLLRRIERDELSSQAPDYAKARLASLGNQFAIGERDLVVAMMWNTDRTDVDLHVIEPSGEECYYQRRRTSAGGEITRDVTEGYGPEMYSIRQALAGKHRILANYYGSDANRTQARTKVYLTIYENYGAKQQRITRRTVSLSRQSEKRDVATVVVQK